MIQHYQNRQQTFDATYLLYTLDWICQELAEELEDAPDWLKGLHQHWDHLRQGTTDLDLKLNHYLSTTERQHILLYQITIIQVALLFEYPEHIPLEDLPPLPVARPQPIGLIYSQQIATTIDQLAQLLDPKWKEEEEEAPNA